MSVCHSRILLHDPAIVDATEIWLYGSALDCKIGIDQYLHGYDITIIGTVFNLRSLSWNPPVDFARFEQIPKALGVCGFPQYVDFPI